MNDEMIEELHRIYEQQLDHWFHSLLSPETQQKIIDEAADNPPVLIFEADETHPDIVWN